MIHRRPSDCGIAPRMAERISWSGVGDARQPGGWSDDGEGSDPRAPDPVISENAKRGIRIRVSRCPLVNFGCFEGGIPYRLL